MLKLNITNYLLGIKFGVLLVLYSNFDICSVSSEFAIIYWFCCGNYFGDNEATRKGDIYLRFPGTSFEIFV